MKLTPNKFALSFLKFGNEEESVFDESFFDGLLEDPSDEPASEPTASDKEEPAPDKVDPKQEEAPAVEVPAATVEPKQEEAQPQVEVPVVEEQVQQQPQATPPAAEPQTRNLDQIRGELEKHYALTDEQADLLTTDPQKVFPQLAAQLHMQVMSQVLRVFESALPQQLQVINTRQQQYQQVEGQFKQLYPDLDMAKPDILSAVTTAADMIGKQLPQLSMDEKVKRVGLLAHSILGTIPNAASQAAPAKQVAPKPSPVSPAPARGSQASPKPATPSAWDQLLSEFKDED